MLESTTQRYGFGRWCQSIRKRLWMQKVHTERPSTPVAPERGGSPEELQAERPSDTQFLQAPTFLDNGRSMPSLPATNTRLPRNTPPQGAHTGTVSLQRSLECTNSTPSHSSTLNAKENPPSPRPETPSARSMPLDPSSAEASLAKPQRELRFWPTSPSFRGYFSEPEGRPVCEGGYSDVWCCDVRFCEPSEGRPTKIAVKIPRCTCLNNSTNTQRNERLLQRFQQEGITWFGLLNHPNIVPLVGWTLAPNLSFISFWYERGNINNHLKDLSWVERLRLLLGIAKGLEYLHSCTPPVVHGDLKPENILLSDQGEPLLADFGLSTILGEEKMYTASHRVGGSMPWMSPECMVGGAKSCHSDVYSFGSLAFTVLTGEPPHAGLTHGQITLKVCDRTSPKNPVEDWSIYPQLQGSIGDLLRECWARSPEARPSMSTIVERMATLLALCELNTPTPLDSTTN